MPKQPCVYILASGRIGAIYIGVTSNLPARLYQHRSGQVPGFTARYGVTRLVRFEMFADMPTAIGREKQLKRWHRAWKMNLIESDNPDWDDLAVGLGLEPIGLPPWQSGSGNEFRMTVVSGRCHPRITSGTRRTTGVRGLGR